MYAFILGLFLTCRCNEFNESVLINSDRSPATLLGSLAFNSRYQKSVLWIAEN